MEPGARRVQATSCDRLLTPGEGVRIEELLELTHHSLSQYRLPSTGELMPLLQIAPSKTDPDVSSSSAPTGRRAHRDHLPGPRRRRRCP